MCTNEVNFSIAAHAAWAPGIDTPEAWSTWAKEPFEIGFGGEPAVASMPAMLRRRAGFLGKMALETAYQCMGERRDVPAIFCSRHGDVARAVDLLQDLVSGVPLSPTNFGLAVHNASAGLFSIARGDRANHPALAAGASSIEHGVIEACSLLADGATEVLLVAYDTCLPEVFARYEDCAEQPHAWAWLIVPSRGESICLSWQKDRDQDHLNNHDRHHDNSRQVFDAADAKGAAALPASLEVLRFHLARAETLERAADGRCWRWTRHDA